MNKNTDYWKENLRLVAILLAIWFAVSFLFGIILVDTLDAIRIGGVGLGFWFAQQGSIYMLVLPLLYILVLLFGREPQRPVSFMWQVKAFIL